jgi:hypothetical protein
MLWPLRVIPPKLEYLWSGRDEIAAKPFTLLANWLIFEASVTDSAGRKRAVNRPIAKFLTSHTSIGTLAAGLPVACWQKSR